MPQNLAYTLMWLQTASLLRNCKNNKLRRHSHPAWEDNNLMYVFYISRSISYHRTLPMMMSEGFWNTFKLQLYLFCFSLFVDEWLVDGDPKSILSRQTKSCSEQSARHDIASLLNLFSEQTIPAVTSHVNLKTRCKHSQSLLRLSGNDWHPISEKSNSSQDPHQEFSVKTKAQPEDIVHNGPRNGIY